MQVDVSGRSIESHLVSFMRETAATRWMRDMGGGAARVTASVYKKTLTEVGAVGKATRKALKPAEEQIEKAREFETDYTETVMELDQ